ncbi:MAG: sodium:solute symporter [Saprospiraceae bacterium]|nr:sodium:solute symporter [Saprospiraceae bacterium]MCB9326506.1 sodium:solute symporter [Lewinellaceae bacterium]
MHAFDWIVMMGTMLVIVFYGVYQSRNIKSSKSYLMGDRDLPWWTIGLSVMATQASAITFLSTPGQAYEDGMRFAQFYFGLPVAMVFLCIFILPIYYRLNVTTAYEFLEGRFDLKTRTLTAILFLVQRGLAAGITIYAPAIILSTILGWSLGFTVFFIGLIVIFYTVSGGTKAVSVTQKQQMIVILGGMAIAAYIVVAKLPDGIGFEDAVNIAGKMGKLNVVDFTFDLSNRYNFWSGMLGGVFLFVSYFGTDQSQVSRYLSGKSLTQSRLGLLFNGLVKVPMQFLVLFVGILVFVFFLFTKPPVHFNEANLNSLKGSPFEAEFHHLEADYDKIYDLKEAESRALIKAIKNKDEQTVKASTKTLKSLQAQDIDIRKKVEDLIAMENPLAKTKDTDYIFVTFVLHYLPIGLVGLLLAVIFSAAMSSTSAELNALAATTVVDLYRRSIVKDKDDTHYLKASKWFTLVWGGIALLFAVLADLSENLIQLVNIIGSLFYGVILGVFMVAFFIKWIKGKAIFIAAIITEIFILIIFTLRMMEIIEIAYLWLNLIGCIVTIIVATIIQMSLPTNPAVLDGKEGD